VRGRPDIDGLASKSDGRVDVVVWNYHDDLVTVPATPVHLSVTLPPAFGNTVLVTHYRVDDQHSNAYTKWTSLGSPQSPNAATLAQLKTAMALELLEAPKMIDVTAGVVALDFDLPRFGVSLVTLEIPPAGPEPGADGGNAGSGEEGGTSAQDASGPAGGSP